jgi:hypothetical protein
MYFIQYCIICHPSDSTCWRMLGPNPGLLRLRNWQSEPHGYRSHPLAYLTMSFCYSLFLFLYFKAHLTLDAVFCLFSFQILYFSLWLFLYPPPPPSAFHSLFPRDESVGHGEGGKSYGGEIPHGNPLHTPTNCEAGLKMRVGGWGGGGGIGYTLE